MPRRASWIVVSGAALLGLTACGGGTEKVADSDPAKLSAELEARAQAIEEKANQAALAAEQEAGTELASLREAAAAGGEDGPAADGDSEPSAR